MRPTSRDAIDLPASRYAHPVVDVLLDACGWLFNAGNPYDTLREPVCLTVAAGAVGCGV